MSRETLEREGLIFLAHPLFKMKLAELTRDVSGQSWFLIFFKSQWIMVLVRVKRFSSPAFFPPFCELSKILRHRVYILWSEAP